MRAKDEDDFLKQRIDPGSDNLDRRAGGARQVDDPECIRLANDVREDHDRKQSLDKLLTAAHSSNRFERCFALDSLGRLGTLAKDGLQVQIEGVSDSDPFVRDAAAHALLRMVVAQTSLLLRGNDAAAIKKGLIDLIRNHVSEGAARSAVLAFEAAEDNSADVLAALAYAATAQDSYASELANAAYQKLTGRMPEQRDAH